MRASFDAHFLSTQQKNINGIYLAKTGQGKISVSPIGKLSPPAASIIPHR